LKFSRSVLKGVIDSVPGDYYYYATDGRIDTLFKREDGQDKPAVSIAYDSPAGQSNFELEGVLEAEYEFPRYVKTYWNNGNPKDILTNNAFRIRSLIFYTILHKFLVKSHKFIFMGTFFLFCIYFMNGKENV
jgi:hypothetical protein